MNVCIVALMLNGMTCSLRRSTATCLFCAAGLAQADKSASAMPQTIIAR